MTARVVDEQIEQQDTVAASRRRQRREHAAAQPNSRRIYDRDGAGVYLGISTDVVDRLIQTGELPVVRLPIERAHNGRGRAGVLRRIGIDVNDMDALINRSKERLR
jgi:hypothetical protein